MINWDKLIKTSMLTVKQFAEGKVSRDNFRKTFQGLWDKNPARQVVVKKGVKEARKLAKKALKRRNLI